MEISKYMIFTKVAELGNITKAARELNYTQSAISHVINELEKKFGFPLIIRSKTGVTLTDAGKLILTPMRQLAHWETILNQSISAIQGVDAGNLRIGFFCGVSTTWLPQIIKRFHDEHPKVEFSFEYSDCVTLQEHLLQDELDCCFIDKAHSGGLQFFPLYDDDYCVVLPHNHPLSNQECISFSDLEGESFIMQSSTLFDLKKEIAEHHYNIKYYLNDDYSVVALVEQGLGISLLTKMFLQNITGNISIRPLDCDCFRTMGVALHSLKYSTPAMHQLLEYSQMYASTYNDFSGHNYTTPSKE